MKSALDSSCREKLNAHFVSHNSFSFPRKSYRRRINVEKYGNARYAAGHNVKRQMHFARYVSKAKITHSQQVIPILDYKNDYANALLF